MPVEICAVGGFSEVGKNCTAVRVDDEVVIFDMGLLMDKYIAYTESDEMVELSARKLMEIGCVPDLRQIDDWKDDVLAIIPSHAHLDHMGAIPFIAEKLPGADIICTPFAASVLNAVLRDDQRRIPNKIRPLSPNGKYMLSDKLTVEFVHITHSTPQTVLIALHTPYGTVLYANDFKLDNNPILGKPPNYKRIEELGKQGVLCLLLDSLYTREAKKMPSEGIAREMLRDVMLNTDNRGKAVVVTTFSSHIARLKSIVEFGKKMKRKVVFAGRSISKYVDAAHEIGIVDFRRDVTMLRYKDQVRKKLHKIEQHKDEYLIVCTGHQGEKDAILSKIVDNVIQFNLGKGDHVIFSCTTIPAPVNIANRKALDEKLMARGIRIFKDIHVSGHAAREDHREFLQMLRPMHLIPAHAPYEYTQHMASLAKELGYTVGKTVHLMEDGQRVVLE
jgi:ribonuclease J